MRRSIALMCTVPPPTQQALQPSRVREVPLQRELVQRSYELGELGEGRGPSLGGVGEQRRGTIRVERREGSSGETVERSRRATPQRTQAGELRQGGGARQVTHDA